MSQAFVYQAFSLSMTSRVEICNEFVEPCALVADKSKPERLKQYNWGHRPQAAKDTDSLSLKGANIYPIADDLSQWRSMNP